MLVPQNHICPRCGRFPAYPTPVCPSCGVRLPVPWPGQNYGPYPSAPFSPIVLVSQPNYTPLIVELLLNFLGIYGAGWLLLGNTTRGLVLLIVSLVLWPVVFLLVIFTLGVGLLCLGPLAIGAIVCNILLLQQAIKRKAC